MRIGSVVGYLLCALLLVLWASPAQASRALLSAERLQTIENPPPPLKPIPPPEGQIEGACGLAMAPASNDLYVSDYHHRVVDVFSLGAGYQSQIVLPGQNPVPGINTLNAVCGLAFDPGGTLYANEWHEGVLRLLPSVLTIDSGESTGVAVDGAGNLYVNDRTYVAEYLTPVDPGDEPVEKIGLGSLGDGYGVAVAAGRVYVPDAKSGTIKVYEPAVDPVDPVATIGGADTPQGRFVSLVDAAVAIDPTNGHLLVVDNLQPGFKHPVAAVYEFDSSGDFLGTVAGFATNGKPSGPIHGEPSGLTVDPATGRLFVTNGNSEKANVFEYGPYTASAPPATQPSGQAPASEPGGLAASALGAPAGSPDAPTGAASAADIVQRGPVRLSIDGRLTPHALPRHGSAPVGIAVDAGIAATNSRTPPQLRRISIAINRNGRFTSRGLPVCRLENIQPSTTVGALAACGSSLVGKGHFSANVKLPEQSPFPSAGKVLAFNARLRGKPAIFAHIYGTEPIPTSNVLPFLIKGSQGTYGTILEASLPQATGDWGYVTGLKIELRRQFSYRGEARSYLSAGCPAPAGFPGAVFPLARTSFAFAGGVTLVSVLSRSCSAKG